MAETYEVPSDSDTWDTIADRLDIPLDALLRANCLDPDQSWPAPGEGEEIALPSQPDDAAIAPENDHTLDIGGDDTEPFDLPPQKKYLPEQPDDGTGDSGTDDGTDEDSGPDEPILVAANDDRLVASLLAEARAAHANRGKDTSATEPGGNFIPVRAVGTAARPDIKFDHGFLDDGRGGIDDSKRRAPTVSDILARKKWGAKLVAAKIVRPDLSDATRAYDHFLDASGTDLTFSYDDYVDSDRAGACALASAIDDIRAGAVEIHENRGMKDDAFTIQTGAIPVGAFKEDPVTHEWKAENPRYPYAGTENWQKAIGAHVIWLEASVRVDTQATPGRRKFVVQMTLHAEDRYNFNPGNEDIATGTPDEENGRFEVTGLAKEFNDFATLTREIRFSLPLAKASDLRAKPDDQIVLGPNDSPPASDEQLDGGLPAGGT
jgi:hypothetical protein